MSTWLYRIMMTLLAVILISQIVVIAITPAPVVECVNGYVMEQHKDMWAQRGLLPADCVPVDKD
jgi:hypothetical protein